MVTTAFALKQASLCKVLAEHHKLYNGQWVKEWVKEHQKRELMM